MIKYLGIYRDYMIVTKGYSINTVNAYLRDIKQYFEIVKDSNIDSYFEFLAKNHFSVNSQNRKISALNSYYTYLMEFNYFDSNPFYNSDGNVILEKSDGTFVEMTEEEADKNSALFLSHYLTEAS